MVNFLKANKSKRRVAFVRTYYLIEEWGTSTQYFVDDVVPTKAKLTAVSKVTPLKPGGNLIGQFAMFNNVIKIHSSEQRTVLPG